MKEIIPKSKKILDRIDVLIAEERKDDEVISWEDAKRELKKHYDEDALNSFRKTGGDYRSGEIKGDYGDESMSNIREQINNISSTDKHRQ